ncbi:malonyl-ACP decarboxylase [Jatrophihabitans endophyticus]|uniref:Malonyl-ACP decarboxylase n=1 Tax=Jatrophihabitans endophyticus TaxID=1206085 RepID=A0A1M5I5X0_9ACTN|nr:beta-ketoacyl synthase N-terminal-like domain-containing protein [Jatrophihabitans endophyticus]SHG23766.1 malonyl-ACP decarboxylase [Jatrophihabitans endophyticus]
MTAPGVVTGVGAVCSVAGDVAAFEKALRAGTSGFRAVSDDTAEDGVRLLAPLADFDFETALENTATLSPERRDAVRRVGLRAPLPVQATLSACAQAWADAGLDAVPTRPDRVAILVGGSNLTQRYVSDNREVYEEEPAYLPARYALRAQDTDFVAAISEAFHVLGEGYTVGASSSSGNAAVILASRLLAVGAADVCLAVGPMTQFEPAMLAALDKLGVLAEADGEPGEQDVGPRPFDRRRDGFVPGEGAGCVILESPRSARMRGVDTIVELGGVAQAMDGTTLPDPNVHGEARAMAKALDEAGIPVDRVDYVNAHATATPAGDDTEAEAVRSLLRAGRPWVNATKGLIGHCLSAAGVIEAVATVIQMRHGFVHPNPALDRPIDRSLRLVGAEAVTAELHCALSNSFGFGGFNSSIVLLRD